MLGRKPSFKLLSNRRISSTEVALVIASLTLLASSLDRSRPAFPGAIAGRGSSAIVTFFAAPVDTVVDKVVARAFRSPSTVKNKPFAVSLSYNTEFVRSLWYTVEEKRTLSRIL
jgi:hypothetical protein